MAEKLRIALAVDDLLAILDALGREKAVLVGHSNGTYIAQELAFRQPERVQALVIADGTCITWSHGPMEMFLLRHSAAFMRLLPFEMLKKAGLKAFSRKQEVREYVYRAFSQIPKRDFVQIWDGVVKGLHAEPGYRIVQPLL
jgi:3-oxoadipate enol-lactonase